MIDKNLADKISDAHRTWFGVEISKFVNNNARAGYPWLSPNQVFSILENFQTSSNTKLVELLFQEK